MVRRVSKLLPTLRNASADAAQEDSIGVYLESSVVWLEGAGGLGEEGVVGIHLGGEETLEAELPLVTLLEQPQGHVVAPHSPPE